MLKLDTSRELKAGSWGTCALVGSGANLLKQQYGNQIDAHDTVIRYNSPLDGYTKHVGKKTHALFVKTPGNP